MAESFGCCSSYMECSDAQHCIKSDNPDYSGCAYRKKLEAGIIYYGINAGKTIKKAQPIQKPKTFEIYIACYQQLFAVFSRNKNTFSYKLSEGQFNNLFSTFDGSRIPFRTRIDPLEDIEGDLVEITAPSNSRVIFGLGGEEFNVLAFNGYLMKNYFAEKIAQALKAKGIGCRVESIGTHFKEKGEVIAIRKQVDTVEVKKADLPAVKPAKYIQASVFDLFVD